MTNLVPLLASLLLLFSPATDGWTWPLPEHQMERDFAPPVDEYGAGHRGIDLAGTPGATVVAVAAGTVTFVGDVAGTPVVTVTHGSERSTYQPVAAVVEVGSSVAAGELIGTLLPGHLGCAASACLHLGRLAGDTYLDPLDLLGGRYRLISPDGPVPTPPRLGNGTLALPVEGVVTSGFGSRIHPITGQRKLHDGIDFGAPCGSPVAAAAAGTVRLVGTVGGYGTRIEIDHGNGVVTSYSHLLRTQTSVGTNVAAGQVIAEVGSTGTSTGCHLHFSVHENGIAVDPAPLL